MIAEHLYKLYNRTALGSLPKIPPKNENYTARTLSKCFWRYADTAVPMALKLRISDLVLGRMGFLEDCDFRGPDGAPEDVFACFAKKTLSAPRRAVKASKFAILEAINAPENEIRSPKFQRHRRCGGSAALYNFRKVAS